jgi:hypothetical protein
VKNGQTLLAALALCTTLAWAGNGGRTPQPEIVIEQPGPCVADKDNMRRNHPDMLRHQRDKVLYEGVRGAKVSLNGCIACHASQSNRSVLGSRQSFCQSCHDYAAVKLDCFECHQASPGKRGALAARGGKT